jgi:hypothetical protein
MFGAMSFALEEVWLRAPEGFPLRQRAIELHDTVRNEFIRYHEERTPRFEAPPPKPAADTLNPLVSLPAGTFSLPIFALDSCDLWRLWTETTLVLFDAEHFVHHESVIKIWTRRLNCRVSAVELSACSPL